MKIADLFSAHCTTKRSCAPSSQALARIRDFEHSGRPPTSMPSWPSEPGRAIQLLPRSFDHHLSRPANSVRVAAAPMIGEMAGRGLSRRTDVCAVETRGQHAGSRSCGMRPVDVCKVQFAVGALPRGAGKPVLATRANDQVGIGQPSHVKMTRDRVRSDRFDASASAFPSVDGSRSIARTASVIRRDPRTNSNRQR